MTNLASLLNSDGKTVSHSDKRLANRFLKYWEGLLGSQDLPLITDLNLNEMGELLPYTFNLDISTGSDNPSPPDARPSNRPPPLGKSLSPKEAAPKPPPARPPEEEARGEEKEADDAVGKCLLLSIGPGSLTRRPY